MTSVPDAAAQSAGAPRDLPLQSGLKPGYDVFIIVVTVLSIINWVFLLIPANLGSDTRSLLIFMEPIFIVILLLDFALTNIRDIFVRQIFFHEWESRVHSMAEAGVPLPRKFGGRGVFNHMHHAVH